MIVAAIFGTSRPNDPPQSALSLREVPSNALGVGLPVVVVWTIALLFTVGIGVGAQMLASRLA